MSPKNKKNKKKEESKNIKFENNEKSARGQNDAICNQNECTGGFDSQNVTIPARYDENMFNFDEATKLAANLKTQNLYDIPIVYCLTLLNKAEALKNQLEEGVDINACGPKQTTALMLAVKEAKFELIEYLLSKGADPGLKDSGGDNILLLALESKQWEEAPFISLWYSVRNVTNIDINYVGKSGNAMTHIAVRRDWLKVLNVLIEEHANINSENVNGVTPLMVACFRNNFEMAEVLILAGANVVKEDCRGSTALCYAISSCVVRGVQPPSKLIDKMQYEFSKHNYSFRNYLKKRIKFMSTFYDQSRKSNQTDTLLHVVIFAMRYVKLGLRILLETNIFEEALNVIENQMDNIYICRCFLQIATEVAAYNENCSGFSANMEKEMLGKFFSTNWTNFCLNLMKKYEKHKDNKCLLNLTMHLLSQVCVNNEYGLKWFEQNYKELAKYYEIWKNMEKCSILNLGNTFYEETVKSKIKLFSEKFKELKMNNTDWFVDDNKTVVSEADDERTQDSKQTSKKSKRRAKALKAKIAKLRSADVTKRFSISGKMIMEQKSNTFDILSEGSSSKAQPKKETKPAILPEVPEEKNIVLEIKKTLLDLPGPVSEFPKGGMSKPAAKCGPSAARNTQNYYEDNQESVQVFYQKSDSLEQKYYTPHMLDSASDYLKKLLHKIISVYQAHWRTDEELKYIRVPRCHGDSTSKEEPKTASYKSKDAQLSEAKCLSHLENEFDSLLLMIQSQARRNMPLCQMAINKLENLLLTHEIRGKTIIAESLSSDCFRMYYCPFNDDVYEKGSGDMEHLFSKNFKEFLNHKSDKHVQVDVKKNQHQNKVKNVADTSFKDVVILSRGKSINEKKAQRKTMDNAYHLLPSIASLLDDDGYIPEEPPLASNKKSTSSVEDANTDIQSKAEYSEVLLKALLNQNRNSCVQSNVHNKWCSMIQSLQNLNNYQTFSSCDLRVSCKRKQLSYIISRTGTFSFVELGLDKNNRPLAIKRIPRESEICRTLKLLINPLLRLRNAQILHYFACDYEENELILATPLCEYNLGQYLMHMKQTSKPFLPAADVISQFLAGVMYLHHCREPVVHGNLKPSNIFIDFSGVVRIAEFGIHQALFVYDEAPDSSVIWFSQETYKKYKQSLSIECTTSSDIQVAGMLVHFILTAGEHPYGRETKEIMKNLEKSAFRLLTRDPDLLDLLTWMLMYEPNDRPAICQVLSHVFFWSSDRKWCFILTCAGVSFPSNTNTIDLDELYPLLDQTAINYDIKGSWVVVVKKAFPYLNPMLDDDTPTGLLRFIKLYYEKRIALDIDASVFRSFILTSFPVLPLSLYRMLQPTSWMKHPAFISFSAIG